MLDWLAGHAAATNSLVTLNQVSVDWIINNSPTLPCHAMLAAPACRQAPDRFEPNALSVVD